MMPIDVAALAALVEVAPPSSATSPGALVPLCVADGIARDLAEVGLGMHLAQIAMTADDAVPTEEAEAWAPFVDLGLFGEGLDTEGALEAVGRRLAVALVAQATQAG